MAGISLEHRSAFLAGHPMFARLAPDARRQVAGALAEHHYEAGATVFLAGDAADRMYIVVRGTVRIVVTTADGREALLNVMRQNDVFGEIALIDNKARTASAVALTESVFFSLTRPRFLELLGQAEIAAGLFGVLVERLRHMSDLVYNLALRGSDARIAFILGLLVDRHGHKTAEGTRIDLALTQTHLATLAHTSRATVNAELTRLEGLGIVKRVGRGIHILDRQALAREVEKPPGDHLAV
jgi:CRP/FNR family transcriptional regulator